MLISAGSSPEAQLLLACARCRLDDAHVAAARAALARGIQWDLLLRTAELQGIAPLAHANLTRLFAAQIPASATARLRRMCRGITGLNLSYVAELRRLLKLFDQRRIPALPFKGPTLAASAYGSSALRPFGDLDILVHEHDAGAARRLLVEAGYVLGYHVPGQEYHFEDRRRQITVDLHERLASSCYPQPPAFDILWNRSRPISLAGGTVRGLSAEDTAFGLCLHLAKDYCTWKERVSQLCDLSELMRAEPALPWDRVLDHAAAVGGERMVLLALWLAGELLGTTLPDRAVEGCRRDPHVARLGSPITERLRRQLDGSLEYVKYRREAQVEDFWLLLAIRERPADRLRVIRDLTRIWLGRRVTPTEDDRRFLPLPRRLAPLYYLIRPVRVARDRLRRAPRGPRRPSLMFHLPRRTQ